MVDTPDISSNFFDSFWVPLFYFLGEFGMVRTKKKVLGDPVIRLERQAVSDRVVAKFLGTNKYINSYPETYYNI